jgi:prepilin-type N-terminal cleavage/methylation domain-containing protein
VTLRNQAGFTLVEALIVTVVLSIAGLMMSQLFVWQARQQKSVTIKAQLDQQIGDLLRGEALGDE